ncbi:hypothetical protein Tcan_16230 [Toxocara canis]|uniref:Uncharacterized protein n=1 Tax=Toxocara canis TaxID=6265 RepID=A0A0B2UXG5_TOXCA|nr:hypothetical protein Tcan_16230 [Toxocara canis]
MSSSGRRYLVSPMMRTGISWIRSFPLIVLLLMICTRKSSTLKCISSTEGGNAFYSELVGKQVINVCSDTTRFCKKIYMWNTSGHSIERDCDGGRACEQAGCELNMTISLELCCCESNACNTSIKHDVSHVVVFVTSILSIIFMSNNSDPPLPCKLS